VVGIAVVDIGEVDAGDAGVTDKKLPPEEVEEVGVPAPCFKAKPTNTGVK
jgi:hypothetical protein